MALDANGEVLFPLTKQPRELQEALRPILAALHGDDSANLSPTRGSLNTGKGNAGKELRYVSERSPHGLLPRSDALRGLLRYNCRRTVECAPASSAFLAALFPVCSRRGVLLTRVPASPPPRGFLAGTAAADDRWVCDAAVDAYVEATVMALRAAKAYVCGALAAGGAAELADALDKFLLRVLPARSGGGSAAAAPAAAAGAVARAVCPSEFWRLKVSVLSEITADYRRNSGEIANKLLRLGGARRRKDLPLLRAAACLRQEADVQLADADTAALWRSAAERLASAAEEGTSTSGSQVDHMCVVFFKAHALALAAIVLAALRRCRGLLLGLTPLRSSAVALGGLLQH